MVSAALDFHGVLQILVMKIKNYSITITYNVKK